MIKIKFYIIKYFKARIFPGLNYLVYNGTDIHFRKL